MVPFCMFHPKGGAGSVKGHETQHQVGSRQRTTRHVQCFASCAVLSSPQV